MRSLFVLLLCLVVCTSLVVASVEDESEVIMEDEQDGREMAHQEFTSMFERHDANKDGKLDASELRSWVEHEEGEEPGDYAGSGHIDSSIRELLEEADINGDQMIEIGELMKLSGFDQ
eukprot:TRINITY_DN11480_c0_g1_i1.p3 TRINITY_DN11480_c0_g1~~TRINITY_DN11480_c0_g1_i1.p3  ORF type:complete len:118 (+),score=61.52 TRINITY_DN11480_c0_g1_i1:62-415(+)